MARSLPIISRNEAINRLRQELLEMTDIETSACKAAADQGCFCNGFRRYTDAELRKRYDWIVARYPTLTREELERIANDWQLAQQEVFEKPIACDVQSQLHDTCRGWDDFTNDQLARFVLQLTGQEVVIS